MSDELALRHENLALQAKLARVTAELEHQHREADDLARQLHDARDASWWRIAEIMMAHLTAVLADSDVGAGPEQHKRRLAAYAALAEHGPSEQVQKLRDAYEQWEAHHAPKETHR